MEQFKITSQELLKKIEELIKQGNIRRIIVKNAEGKTYIEIPLTIGVIGVLAAPVMAAIGAVAGLIANFKFEVIKRDEGEVIQVTEIKETKTE